MSSAEIETLLENLANTVGVIGVVVCDFNGIPIRDTFPDLDRTQAIAYATTAATLARDARQVVVNEGGLTALRVRTRANELIIKASDKYLLVVVQDAQPAS